LPKNYKAKEPGRFRLYESSFWDTDYAERDCGSEVREEEVKERISIQANRYSK
jgi:hypothetical protein